jgi:hypothetical protein
MSMYVQSSLFSHAIAQAGTRPRADTSKREERIDQLAYPLSGLTEQETDIVNGKA